MWGPCLVGGAGQAPGVAVAAQVPRVHAAALRAVQQQAAPLRHLRHRPLPERRLPQPCSQKKNETLETAQPSLQPKSECTAGREAASARGDAAWRERRQQRGQGRAATATSVSSPVTLPDVEGARFGKSRMLGGVGGLVQKP